MLHDPSRDAAVTSPVRTPPHLITLVLLAGSATMAMNIFLPVLPVIANDLQTTPATAQLLVTLFLGATAVVQLFIGPLSDRYGRRPVLLVTISTFIGATILCIFAPTIEWLLFGRVLQTTSAASLALSRAIIRDLYDRSKAASMIGYVTMAMAVIPMLAPALGGYVGEAFGWRATFVVLAVISTAMLFVVWFDLGETHVPVHDPDHSQIEDTRQLVREPAVWGYVATSTFASGAYFAFLGGAAFVAADVIGLSATAIGWNFMTVAGGYIVGNFLAGRYSERVGIERMMLLGGVIASVGVGISLALMTLFEPRAAFLFWPMVLVGMGNGMTLPNANAGVLSVRPELAGSASGLAGFSQIGGGAALAALAGWLSTAENEGMPLFVIMFVSSILGALVAWIMLRRSVRTA